MNKKYYIAGFSALLLFIAFFVLIEVDLKKTSTLNKLLNSINNEQQYIKEAPEIKELKIKNVLDRTQDFKSFLREDPRVRRGTQQVYEELIFTDYVFCCNEISWSELGNKPLGYIEVYKDYLIFVTGYGDIFTIKNSDLGIKENVFLNRKSTNIENIIKNKSIFDKEMDGIRGIDVFNNSLYISYMEKTDGCYSIHVLVGDLNNKEIEFKKFFEPLDCIDPTEEEFFAAAAGGGKIEITKNGSVYLTVGNFEAYDKSQNIDSIFGKIIKIIDLHNYEIISIGHRNPQGLSEVRNSNFLISTEHGPWGGDEVNLINKEKILNFGWPQASYGRHYEEIDNQKLKDIAPLMKPHKEYGFEEPIYWVDYSPFGISDIIINYFSEKNNSFYLGTLNRNYIYKITFSNDFKEVTEIKSISTSNRLRDMTYDQKNKRYLVLYEQPPKLTVIEEIQKNE
tara:strand:- start:33313 stop:34665 length:1353 start_codon:yes stop_codon:yes gene_type:complete